jgi:hypothetical protein
MLSLKRFLDGERVAILFQETSMSDPVLITLIVAIAVIVVLILFRRQLSDFLFKANKEGVEAHLKTHDPQDSQSAHSHGVQIRRNRLVGRDNEIEVQQEDVGVDENLVLGKEQKIQVKSKRKKK